MAKRGRPLLFPNLEELKKRIEQYFKQCDSRTKKEIVKTKDGYDIIDMPFPIPYTIEGFAHFLGTSRQTILNYEEKDEYFDAIAQARAKILADKVEGGMDGRYNPLFTKFLMENNYDYSEKDKEDKDVNITLTIEKKPPYQENSINGEADKP